MRAALAFLLGGAIAPNLAWAAEGSGGLDVGGKLKVESIALLDGACSRLLVAGKDASKGCVPKFANIVFEGGRIQFAFTNEGQPTSIAFSGDGNAQVKLTPDKVSQPIDRMIVTIVLAGATRPEDISTKVTPARGACVYTNPYKAPSQVLCTADTAEGRFEATFTSDGKPPVIKDFD